MVFKTVVQGEQAMIFNDQGQGRLVIGPSRIWLALDEDLEYLTRIVASQDQYMIVKHRDGRKEHISGPTEMFLNRLQVDSIDVGNVVKLDANHLVVVYRQLEEKIESRIVRGPCIFVPSAQEWLHDFVWHGEDPQTPGRFIPSSRKFVKLCHIPSQMYCNVKDVRTNDDALITVKLMLFYQLVDVDTMLSGSHDPIADFINAVQSDIVSFASQRNFDEFILQTHDLSQIECYHQLTSRAKLIGYSISKVVYRGYVASSTLQSTHDNAVHIRTQIRLNKEAEEKEQVLLQFRLQREKQRTKLKQEMERKEQDHQQELDRLKQNAALEKARLIHEAKLKNNMAKVQLQVETDKMENEQKCSFLLQLQGLGLDMSKYLLALQKEFVPEKQIVIGPATREVQLKALN